jgi:hypothetical protein
MRDFNPSQGFRPPESYLDNEWSTEENYWRDNWHTRPYAAADLGFEYYQPGFRYGFEASRKHRGRQWEEIQPELQAGWERYEHRGESAWDRVQDAVQDAWRRAAGRYNQN